MLFHEFISAVNSKLFQLSSGTHNHPDNVLIQGDNMYLNAFNNDLIPREGFLSLNNLPTVVCCRWLEDKSNNSSIETCRSVIDTNISPVEAQKYTIDLPILRGSTSLAIVTPSNKRFYLTMSLNKYCKLYVLCCVTITLTLDITLIYLTSLFMC